ncbi:hypothetical protein [Duganella sp. CF458]|nr:hypothetical protein [Duganella sp. CF458]
MNFSRLTGLAIRIGVSIMSNEDVMPRAWCRDYAHRKGDQKQR